MAISKLYYKISNISMSFIVNAPALPRPMTRFKPHFNAVFFAFEKLRKHLGLKMEKVKTGNVSN